jgi:cell wall-associated NlpC family hydrolase
VPSSPNGAKVVEIAMSYMGVPYVWAGSSPSGFDCSGFVRYVYAKVGISLPHSSRMMYDCGTSVSRDQLEPGDLVFFYNPIHHVGIYIGNGQMINARSGGVGIDGIWQSYYGAKRIL